MVVQLLEMLVQAHLICLQLEAALLAMPHSVCSRRGLNVHAELSWLAAKCC